MMAKKVRVQQTINTDKHPRRWRKILVEAEVLYTRVMSGETWFFVRLANGTEDCVTRKELFAV